MVLYGLPHVFQHVGNTSHQYLSVCFDIGKAWKPVQRSTHNKFIAADWIHHRGRQEHSSHKENHREIHIMYWEYMIKCIPLLKSFLHLFNHVLLHVVLLPVTSADTIPKSYLSADCNLEAVSCPHCCSRKAWPARSTRFPIPILHDQFQRLFTNNRTHIVSAIKESKTNIQS
jgi:hypothetical protein